jgi:orotate phosphoribosyltransferase
MKEYQRSFINFLIRSEALRFGEFTLKSGRVSPHFFNSAQFNSGGSISTLAGFYAQHLLTSIGQDCKTIFGPAYKGIPLAVATAINLAEHHKCSIGYTFNRKEAKAHGDGGVMVGTPLEAGMPLVIVEDVITAGTTLKEIVPLLREQYRVEIRGVIIALDRCERGADSGCSAKAEAERDLNIRVFPLVTIHDVIEHIETAEELAPLRQYMPATKAYLEAYGSK